MKFRRSFHIECRALADGRRDFDTFWQRTLPVWRGLAMNLYRRWPSPSVTYEDVLQEMAFAIPDWIPRYDPNNDGERTLADFLVWNVCNEGKYELHKARQAILHGNHDKNKSRTPIPFSHMHDAEGDGSAANRFAAGEVLPSPYHPASVLDWFEVRRDVSPEAQIDGKRFMMRAIAHAPFKIQMALAALLETNGSIQAAGAMLYDDYDLRRNLRLGNRAQSRAVVRSALRYLLELTETKLAA